MAKKTKIQEKSVSGNNNNNNNSEAVIFELLNNSKGLCYNCKQLLKGGNKKMKYEEIYNNLQKSINEKGHSLLFAQSVKDLKVSFGVDVSTKFLRGLSDLDDSRKTTKRISYLMRKSNFKTKRVTNLYKVRGINKYKTSVVTWGRDKTSKPFPEVVGLTDDEKRQIEDIEALRKGCGIEMFNHAENDLSDRQKRRDAFNYGGGAVVRDVKVVQVGSYAVMSRSEILSVVY